MKKGIESVRGVHISEVLEQAKAWIKKHDDAIEKSGGIGSSLEKRLTSLDQSQQLINPDICMNPAQAEVLTKALGYATLDVPAVDSLRGVTFANSVRVNCENCLRSSEECDFRDPDAALPKADEKAA